MSRFNDEQVKNIIAISKEMRFNEALKKIEWYLEDYPDDLRTVIVYGGILLKVGNVDSARKVIEYLENVRNEELDSTRKHAVVYMRMKLGLIEEDYQSVFEMITDQEVLKNGIKDANLIEIICRNELGLPVDVNYNNHGYMYNQMINYDLEKTIEHIESSHIGVSDKSYFNDSFNLREMVKTVTSKLDEVPGIVYIDNINYLRIFKLNKCGISNGKEVDYFGVVTIGRSNKIVTMYPLDNPENIKCLDLNELEYKSTKPIKVVSQIDKFNAKYGKLL